MLFKKTTKMLVNKLKSRENCMSMEIKVFVSCACDTCICVFWVRSLCTNKNIGLNEREKTISC